MRDPLAGTEAKIERGFEHVRELEAEIAAFLHPHPYHVEHEPDDDPGWFRGIFRVDADPPLRFGIIAGEAFGQYRSALDHLAVQLIRLHKPASRDRFNFPICDSRPEFWEPPKSGSDSVEKIVRRLVRPEHFALIEQLQPYHSGGIAVPGAARKPTMLSVIKWFNNTDKHELVHPAYIGPKRFGIEADPNIAELESFYVGAGLHDKTKLYRVRFVDDSEVQVPMRLAVTVAVGPPGLTWIDTVGMRNFGERMRGIVGKFRRITPEFPARVRATPN